MVTADWPSAVTGQQERDGLTGLIVEAGKGIALREFHLQAGGIAHTECNVMHPGVVEGRIPVACDRKQAAFGVVYSDRGGDCGRICLNAAPFHFRTQLGSQRSGIGRLIPGKRRQIAGGMRTGAGMEHKIGAAGKDVFTEVHEAADIQTGQAFTVDKDLIAELALVRTVVVVVQMQDVKIFKGDAVFEKRIRIMDNAIDVFHRFQRGAVLEYTFVQRHRIVGRRQMELRQRRAAFKGVSAHGEAAHPVRNANALQGGAVPECAASD